MTSGTYRNKKTGNFYVTQRLGVINATNAQNGQKMVLYRRFGSDGIVEPWYVREESEFLEKFEFFE